MTRTKAYLESIIAHAEEMYRIRINQNLQQLALHNQGALKVLDVGCADGRTTLTLTKGLPSTEIYGLEKVEEWVASANQKGIRAVAGLADAPFPYSDAFYDVVISNQVVEHLNQQDLFLSEVYRVLKPGGFFLICTDNLASWHNVGALFLGWQPFPMTNFSEKQAGIGNPLALHRGEEISNSSMLHTRLFTLRALKELLLAHDFKVVEVAGAGYYPFPPRVANFMSKLDPAHSAFQLIKAYRP